jgi:hypothetical protein
VAAGAAPATWDFAPFSTDIVIGQCPSNNSANFGELLRFIRRMLAPRGVLALVELLQDRTPSFVPWSLAQLELWKHSSSDDETTNTEFLSKTLHAAGFEDVVLHDPFAASASAVVLARNVGFEQLLLNDDKDITSTATFEENKPAAVDILHM